MASQRVFWAGGATSSISEGLKQMKAASPIPTKHLRKASCQNPFEIAQSPVDTTHTVMPTMSRMPEGTYRLSCAINGDTSEYPTVANVRAEEFGDEKLKRKEKKRVGHLPMKAPPMMPFCESVRLNWSPMTGMMPVKAPRS